MTGGITEDEVRAHRTSLASPVFSASHLPAEFTPRRPICIRPTKRRARRPECESMPTERRKIVILGGGQPYRPGIEFDYCCSMPVSRSPMSGSRRSWSIATPRRLDRLRTSDRLYFEPLTAEDVLEILHVEQQNARSSRHRPVRRPDPAHLAHALDRPASDPRIARCDRLART